VERRRAAGTTSEFANGYGISETAPHRVEAAPKMATGVWPGDSSPQQRERMTMNPMTVPRYVQSFACIGPACSDTCCSGWSVPLDRETYQSWQTIQVHAAGTSLTARTRAAHADEKIGTGDCAVLEQTPEGACTWLTDEKLCAVQARCGEDALPLVCHTYPRQRARAQDRVSMYLNLGCPEAARLALSDPAAMDMVTAADPVSIRPPPMRERRSAGLAGSAECADASLDAVEAAAELLADAARSMICTPLLTPWQALALYWHAISSIVTNDPAEKAQEIEKITAVQRLAREESELLEAARAAEKFVSDLLYSIPDLLQTARMWARALLRKARPTQKHSALTQILSTFDLSADGDAPPSDASCETYLQALGQWFEPFDAAHPHLLKNFLLNRLGILNFPVSGRSGILNELAKEALHMQMLRVFLVGRAHVKQEAFGVDDYIEVVQAYTRYVASCTPTQPAAA
jgi:lysine-N-methylase